MQEYRRSSHCLFDLKVHLVWITKYRKPVLYGSEGTRLRDILRQVCTELEVEIVSGNIRRDHVHLLLSVPPQVCVSKLVQKLKGVSARKLLQESERFKKAFWGHHLWARGYFAVSTGHVTEDIIAEYIQNQDEVERLRSDNFQVGF
ncbi:transposase IS200 like protein [Caedimonas varicaedens]|uniref:Transposase IS200 like protein n=1 Tax=Caedimonas varicaedens TaxID=1629334 RepID=A0A0K8MET0_9PROT|nr:transposase IS200 like protein [Caedimonas varicaedens]